MLDSINVDLPTPFETMLATTLFGNETTIFLRSQSYLPTSSNFDECAVVRSDNNRYPFKQPINSFYALGSTNQQACSQYLNGQNMNQILTNSSLQTRIGSGWWEEEDWGTWMRSTDASIPLIRDFRQGDVIQIYFRTLGSSYFETFAPEISLNGNSFVLTAEEYDSGNFRIKITQELINSEERYTLGFKVQNLIAPSEIGLNSDSRPFGLGVESLEFSDAKRNMP
jgi:hypothetical protein